MYKERLEPCEVSLTNQPTLSSLLLNKLKHSGKEWPLAIIILIGFLMRVKGLTQQSLWLDELYTVNEADPAITWKQLFIFLKCCDSAPPLYFVTERIAFTLFGHTEFVARMVSAIAGTMSILAMYWLGKEFLNKSLGFIVAILTCVNFYNISYSQEARAYIFVFLFTALSFLYFIKLVKAPSWKNAIGYGLFTLCMLYSHYYSLFVAAAQLFLALTFIFLEKKETRGHLFKLFLLSAAIIIIGYLPLLPFLKAVAGMKSFWITTIDHAFLLNYFTEYFGGGIILMTVLVALLLFYVANVVNHKREANLQFKHDPLAFSLVILTGWILITSLIPYLRSVIDFPMLFPRYMIVILPAFLMAVAFGIEMFRRPFLKYSLTLLIVVLSFNQLFRVHHYYTAVSKTQFREMTQFIVENNTANYPIINEVTPWQQGYYLKKYNSKAGVFTGKKESLIDSILSKSSSQYDLKGFWIAGAHSDRMPDDATLARLDSTYTLLKEKQFLQAFAMLYVLKENAGTDLVRINYDQFTGGTPVPEEKTVAVWNGAIVSQSVLLSQGKFNIDITARGDPGNGQYPHLNIYLNVTKIVDYYVTGTMESRKFSFENNNTDSIHLKVEMDNDFAEPGLGDRNFFVRKVVFEKLK